MSQGFEALLENCSMNYGSVYEPAESEIDVFTEQGETQTFDAVGIDEQAGTTVLMGFDWANPDEEALEKIAEASGEDIEEVRGEIDEDILVLRSVVPFDKVTWTEVDTGGLL